MHVILVLGIRLSRSGRPREEFLASIRRGVELLHQYGMDTQMVISGGAGRPAFRSEARTALGCIPEGLHARILLEERSQTARQKIQNVRTLLADTPFETLRVVGTPGQVDRAWKLIEAEWPAAMSRFYPEPVGNNALKTFIQRVATW